ncbi:MAG: ferrous iron transport protein B [Deltaproteobacteria bacterium]|nr:MAG: ferrous iron transport protein B [Deltaproteobacteria bacterium]
MTKTNPGGNHKKVAIVGLPNTGKTQIFNNLTGEYNVVANYPLTTIEIRRTHSRIRNETYEVIDTPGLHSLYIDSEDEKVVRDLIFSEEPEVIIQCIDANQLKQSLTLTADLLELGMPMVISLNAVDETSRRGIWIDSVGLSRLLGVPVVESIAVTGQGTGELRDALIKAQRGTWEIQYGDTIEKRISAIESRLPKNLPYKRKSAILLLMNDPFMTDYLEKAYGKAEIASVNKEVNEGKGRFRGKISRVISRRRSEWVDDITEKVVRRQRMAPRELSQDFARLSRHPVFGIPILLMIIYVMYLLVANVANTIAKWMNDVLWVPIENMIAGISPAGFWHDFLIGDYGVLSLGLSNALITVLPILSVFFVMLHILEDSGYMPNLTVLTKRIFEKIGLSGAAIMPVVLGFGCKTMATLTTKSLHSRRERYIAIYLVAFAIPCAPQMGLNMSILGRMGINAFILTFSVLTFVEIAAGLALNKILKEEEKTEFVQELPLMRLPNPRAVLIKTYYRLYWFLKEAIPVFLYAALVLFAIDKLGILDATKRALSPVIKGLLGLPLEMVDALILCMARHEAAAALIIDLVEKGKLNYVQCIVAVTIATMFVPCLANIMAMIKELGAKRALIMGVIINISSFLIAGALNWVLTVIFQF